MFAISKGLSLLLSFAPRKKVKRASVLHKASRNDPSQENITRSFSCGNFKRKQTMTLKHLGPCTHIRRGDRVVEFKQDDRIYHALCPACGRYMRWNNWTNLSEPLRAQCSVCNILLSSNEIDLQPEPIPHSIGCGHTGHLASSDGESHEPR